MARKSRASSVRTEGLVGLEEGGGEVGVAREIVVELKRDEIATLPSSELRAGLSVARNDNLAAGGAAALGHGPAPSARVF